MAGPLVFIAGWALLGARTEGYDPIRQAISRLAASGAPTRWAMTAALVALGGGMAMFGLALRPRAVWLLPVANGTTALAVAALPLGAGYDTAHGVAAGVGYATLAAIPAAVGGRRPVPVLVSVMSAACLLASALVPLDGLCQRAGLTLAHAWVVVTALGLLRAPTSSSTTPPARGPAARPR